MLAGWLIIGAFLGIPWALAAWLLWRARPRRGWGQGSDGPARLLALAVATLPSDRREWATAMTAELEPLTDRSERWRFALGGLRVALLPPRGSRRLALVVASVTCSVVVAGELVARRAVPAFELFVPTFAAALGLAVTVGAVRWGRVRWACSNPVLATTVVGAVSGAVTAAIWFARAHPSVGPATDGRTEAVLAVVLAVTAALALAPPPALAPSRTAAAVGVLGGVAFGLVLLVEARGDHATGGAVFAFMIFGPLAAAGLVAGVAAAVDRSARSGVVAAVWMLVLGIPLVCAVWLPSAAAVYETQGLLFDGEGGHSIGTNLSDVVWLSAWMLLIGLPYGVIGAAMGAGAAQGRPSLPGRA